MPIEVFIRRVFYFNLNITKVIIKKNYFCYLDYKNNFSNFLNLLLIILKNFVTFKNLIDLVGVDWPMLNLRFQLVYNLLSINLNFRCFLFVSVGENTVYSSAINFINSGINVYSGLNWLERENWDMLGILFFNHIDLRRILTDYGFEGFPLRKDFPLTGFVELRYDEEQKSIIYEDVELSQEFRFFDFESPWKK
jgi:NADH-quinone oxidoreductase subunit C